MKRFWPELCHPADWMLSPFALLIPEQTESGASAVVARQGSAKLERQVIAHGYHYVDSNQMAKLTSESILNYLDTCVEASHSELPFVAVCRSGKLGDRVREVGIQ